MGHVMGVLVVAVVVGHGMFTTPTTSMILWDENSAETSF
jgi:hypothetical protein